MTRGRGETGVLKQWVIGERNREGFKEEKGKGQGERWVIGGGKERLGIKGSRNDKGMGGSTKGNKGAVRWRGGEC